jgi:hypothetical protein
VGLGLKYDESLNDGRIGSMKVEGFINFLFLFII